MHVTDNKVSSQQAREKNAVGKTSFFQPRLAINAPGDASEQEADAVADTIMRMPNNGKEGVSFFKPKSFIQRKCTHCEEEKIRRTETGAATAITAPAAAYIHSLSGGKSLDKNDRSFFESKMGYDFSAVRIHNDTVANESAKSINASAYTYGNNIVFASHQYQPQTNNGKKLLAHELTHVVQQRNSIYPKLIQRQEVVSEHSKSGMQYAQPVQIDKYKDTTAGNQISGYNYWYQKISAVYSFGYSSNAAVLSQLDANNFSILLAKGWELRPAIQPSAANPAPTGKTAFLPVQVGVTASSPGKPYLLYCMFNYSFRKGSTKPDMELTIMEAIAQKTLPVNINEKTGGIKRVPADIEKTLDNATGFGFPARDVKTYFTAHPEVKESIGKYVQWRFSEYKKTKAKDDLSVTETISTSEVNQAKPENIMLLLSMGANRDAGVYFITLHYSKQSSNTVPAGYNQKDYIDFLIEKHAQDHPGAGDKLGKIDGLDSISDTNERMIVKAVAFDVYASEYDKGGIKQKSFRDTEIDQVIAMSPNPADPSKTEYYYYTFVVHKADVNNIVHITVKRIGKKGDAVVADPGKPLIIRVPGYAENAYDANNAETPDKLIKWILSIYKGVTEAEIKAATVADITAKINAVIESKSGTPEWFKKNYAINILGAAAGAQRLKTVHKLPNAELAGVKDYTADELKGLELALQRLGKVITAKLQNIYFIRQEKNLSPDYGWVSGLTQQPYTFSLSTKIISAVKKTITMYDSAFAHENIFLGGLEGINPANIGSLTHEIGHAVGGPRVGLKTAGQTYQDHFNTFYKALNLVPVTAYAKDTSEPTHSPETEYFPEAFMLFMDDPEWLLNNQYQTYLWFLFFQDKGTSPSVDQVKSLISIWESQKTAAGSNAGIAAARAVYYLWRDYAVQKKKVPDADHTTTLVLILSEFIAAKQRAIRSDEASGIVTKWLSFVLKNKRQPAGEEVRTFFP